MSRIFTKKQIKALLGIMSKDKTRPALCALAFKDSALVATDGYMLVAMNISSDWKENYNDDDGARSRLVPRKVLEDWCKEHGAKDTISVEELFERLLCKTSIQSGGLLRGFFQIGKLSAREMFQNRGLI